MRDELTVTLKGRRYAVLTARLTRSLEQAASQLSLTLRPLSSGARPYAIDELAGCEIELEDSGERLFTGFVDVPDTSVSTAGRSLSLSARSRTSDLMDATVDAKPFVFRQATLSRIIHTLVDLRYHTASVFGDSELNRIIVEHLAITPGQKVQEVLSKLLEPYGYLLTDTEWGRLLITRPGSAKAADQIATGRNIAGLSASYDYSQLYSSVTVTSSVPLGSPPAQSDDDEADDEERQAYVQRYTQVQATATDSRIKRHRPLLIKSEAPSTKAYCLARAEWELAVRRAKSCRFSCSLPGWRQSDDSLWAPGLRVNLGDPELWETPLELLISTITYNLSGSGRQAQLELTDPAAYAPPPQITRSGKRASAFAPVDAAAPKDALAIAAAEAAKKGGGRAR